MKVIGSSVMYREMSEGHDNLIMQPWSVSSKVLGLHRIETKRGIHEGRHDEDTSVGFPYTSFLSGGYEGKMHSLIFMGTIKSEIKHCPQFRRGWPGICLQ